MRIPSHHASMAGPRVATRPPAARGGRTAATRSSRAKDAAHEPSAAQGRRKAASRSARATEVADVSEELLATGKGDANATVKMKLRSFLRRGPNVGELHRIINQDVATANVAMVEAYSFANFYVMHLMETDAASHLPVMDQMFFYRCLKVVTICPRRASLLQGIHDMERCAGRYIEIRRRARGVIDVPSLQGKTQLISDLAATMETMAQNHLWVNLFKRVYAYVRFEHPELTGLWKRIAICVADRPLAPLEEVFRGARAPPDLINRAMRVAEELRLPRDAFTRGGRRKIGGAHLTLPLYYKILQRSVGGHQRPERRAAGRQSARPPKPFSLLPRKQQFTTSYVPISTLHLVELLKIGGLIEIPRGSASDGRDLNQADVWSRYFCVEKVNTARRRFHMRILTDGCSVSVVMSHPTSLQDPQAPADLPNVLLSTSARTRTVSVDPGYTDFVTTFTQTFDAGEPTTADGVVRSFSSAQYYDRAKFFRSQRRIRQWNKETHRASSSILPAEVGSTGELALHLESLLAVHLELLDHRFHRGFRNLRFLRYIHRQRAIREICDFIAPPGLHTVVGFGAWNPGSESRVSRRASGPLQEVRQMLASREDVTLVPLDEYRSSSVCSCCHGPLTNKMDYTFQRHTGRMSRRKQRVHKVLHCRHGDFSRHMASHVGTTWDRDENAARNLHAILIHRLGGLERPAAFQRAAPRR